MVSVVPPTLHGGNTAATREPSGRRESRIGCPSEMSSPSERAMFFTATLRFAFVNVDAVDGFDDPVALVDESGETR